MPSNKQSDRETETDAALVKSVALFDELPQAIARPLRVVDWAMLQIVLLSGLLMAFTFAAVVIIRYGFGGDLFAYEEWLLGASIVGFFAGAVLASARNTHINADILGIVLQSPRKIWWRGLIILVIELGVILFMVYACAVSLIDDFSFPRLRATPVLRIPFVSWRIAIMVAFGLMAAFTAAYLYLHVRLGLRADEVSK